MKLLSELLNQQTRRQGSEFFSLPLEVKLLIIQALDVKSLGKIAQTCHYLNYLSSSDFVWQTKLREKNISTLPDGNYKNHYHKNSIWFDLEDRAVNKDEYIVDPKSFKSLEM